MKRWISITLICLLALSILAGCSKSPTVLGNARWDMTKDQLIAAEGEDHIVAGASDQVLNWMQTKELTVFGDRTVSVGYVFSTEGKLNAITVQIFLNEGESMAEAVKSTRAEMEKTYGPAEGEDTTCHWHLEEGTIAFTPVRGATGFFVANFSRATAEHHH